jgi:uncharacterized protein (UPF0297 family)
MAPKKSTLNTSHQSQTPYYNSSGHKIHNATAYFSTCAPMYTNFTTKSGNKINKLVSYVKSGGTLYLNKNINEEHSIYKINVYFYIHLLFISIF